MNEEDAQLPLLVAPGELRADHARLFVPRREAPIELVLAVPGALGSAWPGSDRLVDDPLMRLTTEMSFDYRRAVLAFFARQIDELPQTLAWERSVLTWIGALREGSLRILHDIECPAFTRLICAAEESAVRMAPITASEPAHELDRELDLVLRGAAHQRARDWLTRRRDRAHDISSEVLAVLEASWAGSLLSPSELYLKILYEYFRVALESMDVGDDDNPLIDVMTEFQLSAYVQAKGILRRYGGVFLADVVGLGKTFIAIALLRHLQDHYRQRAVVIAPPAVLPAWRELAEEFQVDIQCVSYGKLADLDLYAEREVLVIDESHNFRNPRTQRKERLAEWLRPAGGAATRKVILVSATPQNNRARDVYHQLVLFPDTFARLPVEDDSLLDFFKKVERGQRAMTRVLQHVVVRRTRRFIQRAYPTATLRRRVGPGEYRSEPLVFPTRVAGAEQCLRYSIDTAYPGGLYDEVMRTLATLRLPRHHLAEFIRSDRRDDPQVAHLVKTPTNLRGLFRVILLKRVESSVEALRLTLTRMSRRLRAMEREIAQGGVRTAGQPDGSGDIDEVDLDGDEFADAALFEIEELRAAIAHDLALIEGLRDSLLAIDAAADSKLTRLRRYLATRAPGVHKVLIFTQFADTAEYLGEHLAEYGRSAVVTGSRGGALAFARRFSPRSNRLTLSDDEELDLLVATDVLSEGVNLQDGDTLINYDLHWNPVRLIQRAGRIDRIGSANSEIHVSSFLPERDLERNLGLEAVLRARIAEFIRVFGEDYKVLPDEEKLHEQEMIDAYTGTALAEADDDDDDDEMDGLSRHIERIIAVRSEDPIRYEGIRELRLGRRAVSRVSGPGVVALHRGPFWRFYRAATAEELVQCDDCDALDVLQRHASGSQGEIPSPAALEELSRLAEVGRRRFEPEAQRIELQRVQPALDASELWVQQQLDELRVEATGPTKASIERALDWILRGQHKHRFRPIARGWRRDGRSPTAIVDEMRRLVRLYPLDDSDADTVTELVGVLAVDELPDPPQEVCDAEISEPTDVGAGSISPVSAVTSATLDLLERGARARDDGPKPRRRFRWRR